MNKVLLHSSIGLGYKLVVRADKQCFIKNTHYQSKFDALGFYGSYINFINAHFCDRLHQCSKAFIVLFIYFFAQNPFH